MKLLSGLLIIIFSILLTGISTANAQDAREKTISSMVNKLQQKVLLTEDQKNQVINIIRSDDSEGLRNSRARVEEIMDQRQKAKYDIIKDDWWRSLNRELQAQ